MNRSIAAACAAALIWTAMVSAQAAQIPRTTAGGDAYNSGGRRDPFVSLVSPARKDASPEATPAARRGPATSLTSLSVSEAVVRGILRSGPTLIAILEGPDGRTFIAHRQDRLLDGAVKSIETNAVVFAQSAGAGGASPPRDVRRLLRPAGGGGL